MAELTPGDNKNKQEQENENIIEATAQEQKPEPTQNLEPEKPSEPATMVGLDQSNFGASAPTTAEIQSQQNTTNQQSGPNSQSLADHQQNEDSIFTASPHSNEAAMAQINLGLQGIEGQVDGVIGSTLQQHQIEEEKAKKERAKTILAISAIQSMQELSEALDAQQEIINKLQERAQTFAASIDVIDETLDPKIQELEDLVKQQEQELQELKDSGASQDEISAKQAELDNSSKLLTLYKDTHASLNSDFQAASQKLQEAQQQQMRLQEEINQYQDSDQEVPQHLLDRLEAVTKDVQTASESMEKVENRIQFSEKMINISSELHKDVAAASMECQSPATILAQTAFVDAVIKASDDGTFTAEETTELAQLAKGSGYSQEQVANFASELANSGIAVLDQDGNNMTPDQIESFILSEWQEIQVEKAEVKQKLDSTTADLKVLEQQIEQAKQTLDQEQAQLIVAQDALKAEQHETMQATQDVQSIKDVMSQYEDINDYMEQNYSITFETEIIGQTISQQFGEGEDINTVAKDENRILKDNDGNFVYMDNEDQTLYTLVKNEDGSLQLDTEGNQVKNILSPEEALSLQSKMYSEKLVPRNFVTDGSYAEYSKDDSFVGTLINSKLGMDKGDQQANIDAALEQQIKQEQIAQTQQQKEFEEYKAAESAAAQKYNDVQNAEFALFKLEQRQTELLEREQQLKQEALAHNVDLGDNTDTAAAESAEESETKWAENEAPAPKADIEEINLIDKIKNLSENSSISKEEFDAIIGDASPELREKIETVLANDGIEITKPENEELANNDITPQENEPQIVHNDPAPEQAQTMTVNYPAIGATAQIQVINAPTTEIPTNGITPAIEYTSFADSPEFAATNDPKNPEATYTTQTNNHTNNVVDASESFGKSLTNQPEQGAGALTPDQLAALEQQRLTQLARDEELRQQTQLAQNDRTAPSAGNTGMM